ncbi:MAG: DJ-1/PfpI family protein [bacterium]|nr:DJ-1/PfpI family protein [bacterium]
MKMQKTQIKIIQLVMSVAFTLVCINLSVAQTTNKKIYQCAPCGCDSDGEHFDQPGNCPSCAMELEEVTTAHPVLKKLDRPLNVAILVYFHAQPLDYAGPYDVFASGGENFNVYTIGESLDPVQTMPNLSINPQFSIKNCPSPDILIIPGGMWNTLNDSTKSWIKTTSMEIDHVMSVCTGAFVLADLGMLDGLNATTHSAGISTLKENYPNILEVKKEVRYVDNGKIITSGGVAAGIDASFYLISKILGDDWAKAIATNLEYPYNPEAED